MGRPTARTALIASMRTSSLDSAAITTAGSGGRVCAGSSRMKPAAACLASGKRPRPCREHCGSSHPTAAIVAEVGRWVACPELGLDEIALQHVAAEALVEGRVRVGSGLAQVRLDLMQGELVAGLRLRSDGVSVQHADVRVVHVSQSVLCRRVSPLDALVGQRQEGGDVLALALQVARLGRAAGEASREVGHESLVLGRGDEG